MALFLLLIYININSKYISTFVFYGNYCMKKEITPKPKHSFGF